MNRTHIYACDDEGQLTSVHLPTYGLEKTEVDPLKQLADLMRENNQALYHFAILFHELTNGEVSGHGTIAKRILNKYGVIIHSKSTCSKLNRVIQVYYHECGKTIRELVNVSPYHLYEILRVRTVTPENVDEWLEKAKHLSRDELHAVAKGDIRLPQFKVVSIDENVHEMELDARTYLAECVGLERISATAYHEFIASLILASSKFDLRALWAEAHGDTPH